MRKGFLIIARMTESKRTRPMKTPTLPFFTAGMISAMTITSTSAVTALIDFGRADASAASPYNPAVMVFGANGSTGAVALNDTTTAPTGWTVTVTDVGSGNGGNAGGGADVNSFPAGLSGFDSDALRNSIYSNQGGGANPSMVLTFDGLSSLNTYDLVLYGSRANAQGLDQRWSLTQGTGGADVDHNSELNNSVFVDWTNISPNGSGVIEVTINSPGPDNLGALALNFGSITENAIPEPSGSSLLALGLGTLLIRRKRS